MSVEELNLSNCAMITDDDIKYLSKCKTLDLSNCEPIREEDADKLTLYHDLVKKSANEITDAKRITDRSIRNKKLDEIYEKIRKESGF